MGIQPQKGQAGTGVISIQMHLTVENIDQGAPVGQIVMQRGID